MTSFSPRFTITHALTTGLTVIERARGFLEAAALSEDWVRRMSQRALLLEAHHTTHIEGTHLTLQQAERLLAGGTVAGVDPDDARELLNYRTAFELVSEYLGSGEPITEGLIREIHRRLVEGVRGGAGAPGEYRRVQNFVVNSATAVVIYAPPPPGDVAPRMAALVAWLNSRSEVHPVLVSGLAQFELVDIHPFVDGNGRTSRLLSTLCLYRAGYDFKRLFSISEYYDRDRAAFYTALQGVRDRSMDLTGWLEFFVEGLATQMNEVAGRGKLAIRRDVIGREYGLNPRQLLAVGQLLENPEMRVEDFEKLCPDAHRRTLQRDLQGLVELRVVKSAGAAKAIRYRLRVKGL